MSNAELPDRRVISNIWSADGVVTFSDRFAKPARVSDEVEQAAANRAAEIDAELDIYRAGRDLTWLGALICGASIVGTCFALKALCDWAGL